MKKLLLILLAIQAFACKTQYLEQERTYIPSEEKVVLKKMPANSKTILYLIRHAESNGNRATNPSLIKKGVKRAHLYSKFFSDKKIDTVFTTNLNRTYETATIIAQAKGVPIIFYDPFKTDYMQFFKNHKGSHSIVVGHSNTTPNFVNGMIGKPKYSQMVEENYSDIFVIAVDGNNSVYDGILVLEDEIQKMEDAKLSPKELKKVLRERKKAAENN